MISFNQYLKEAADSKVNLHLTHADEDLFERGDKGAKAAVEFVTDVIKNVGVGEVKMTTKWDGCVHRDTIIITDIGEFTIEHIIDNINDFIHCKVKGMDDNGNVVWTNLCGGSKGVGFKEWIKVELENGEFVLLTEDHKVHTTNRGWVECKDLEEGDDITQM